MGAATGPLRVLTSNPRYFTDGSGKAIYLTGSHTWNNLQNIGTSDPPAAFDYNGYLDFMVSKNHNFMRMWAWEETKNPGSWFLTGWRSLNVFARTTGYGNALDGKPKFNLTQFNQLYFDTLRARVLAAQDKGIYVSIMLFDGWSIEDKGEATVGNSWTTHPFNINNNINGINGDPNGNGEGEETHTLSISAIVNIQKSYVKKVIDAVNDLDNVIYEIANESHGNSTSWQYAMIDSIKNYEAGKAKQHPVWMTFQWADWSAGTNANLFNSPADCISPNYADGYDSNPPAGTGAKVIIVDTDHIGRPQSTTPIAVWIWKCFLRGLNPILMDWYSYGTPYTTWYTVAEQEAMRNHMGYTLTYANKINLAAMTPQNSLSSTGYCLANLASGSAEYLVLQPGSGGFTVNLSSTPGNSVSLSISIEAGEKPRRKAVTYVTGLIADPGCLFDNTTFTCPS